jgi:hypothetical protein
LKWLHSHWLPRNGAARSSFLNALLPPPDSLQVLMLGQMADWQLVLTQYGCASIISTLTGRLVACSLRPSCSLRASQMVGPLDDRAFSADDVAGTLYTSETQRN